MATARHRQALDSGSRRPWAGPKGRSRTSKWAGLHRTTWPFSPERMSHRVCLDGQTAGVVDLPPEVEAGLTEAQAAEVRAHAYAEAMRRRREILNGA